MKKKITPVIIPFLFILSICCLANQEAPASQKAPPPPQHEKKVFVDEAAKSIYWPMSMPFWVRLANSPDPNAPSFLLEKVHQGSGDGPEKNMTEGITLEIQGRQFIRWYNKVTDETTFLKFYSDGAPPETKIILEHAPTFKWKEKIFYGKGLNLSLMAEDEISGVETLYRSIDGSAYEPYLETMVLDQEKTYHISAYAVDRIGYAGQPVVSGIFVDLTPPQTAHAVLGDFSGGIISGRAAISLTAADPASGVKNTHWGFDNPANLAPYEGKDLPLNGLTDGEHSLFYTSTDNVLNREEQHTYSFYLDKIPPTLSSRFIGDHFKGETKDFVSPRTKLALAAEDNKIGVERIEYRFGKDKYSTYGAPLPLSLGQGEHSAHFRAADKFHNTSAPTKISFYVDGTPPVSKRTVKGPHFTQRNDTWITRDTTVHLTIEDDASGPEGIYYRLGEEGEPSFQRYEAPISVSKEGRYLFKFHGADNVGNHEADQVGILLVDNTPPQLVTTFSLQSKGDVTLEDGSVLAVYPRYTSLFLGASDNSSGIAAVRCGINDAKEEEYTRPLRFAGEGTFLISIHIEDNVGNVANKTVRFVIKD